MALVDTIGSDTGVTISLVVGVVTVTIYLVTALTLLGSRTKSIEKRLEYMVTKDQLILALFQLKAANNSLNLPEELTRNGSGS